MLATPLTLYVTDRGEVRARWTSPCGTGYVARWRAYEPAPANALREVLRSTASDPRVHSLDDLLERAPVAPFVVTTDGPLCRHCTASCPSPQALPYDDE